MHGYIAVAISVPPTYHVYICQYDLQLPAPTVLYLRTFSVGSLCPCTGWIGSVRHYVCRAAFYLQLMVPQPLGWLFLRCIFYSFQWNPNLRPQQKLVIKHPWWLPSLSCCTFPMYIDYSVHLPDNLFVAESLLSGSASRAVPTKANPHLFLCVLCKFIIIPSI